MKFRWIALTVLFLYAGFAQAQYKYIGPHGEVTYSDMPPPPTAKEVQVKGFSTGVPTAGLPYDVGQAVTKFPVTLYAGESCPVCDQARSYLKGRGVPYSEKTVTTREDLQAVQKAIRDSKESNLPVLTVGSQKLVGFTDGALGSMLDDAGYPATSKLPAGYVNPPAEAAAPRAADTTASAPATGASSSSQSSSASPLPPGNAPPGFKF